MGVGRSTGAAATAASPPGLGLGGHGLGGGGGGEVDTCQSNPAGSAHLSSIHSFSQSAAGSYDDITTTAPCQNRPERRKKEKNIRAMAPPGGPSTKRLPCPQLPTHIHTISWSHQLRLLSEQWPGEGLSADLGSGLGPPALRTAGGHRGGPAPLW